MAAFLRNSGAVCLRWGDYSGISRGALSRSAFVRLDKGEDINNFHKAPGGVSPPLFSGTSAARRSKNWMVQTKAVHEMDKPYSPPDTSCVHQNADTVIRIRVFNLTADPVAATLSAMAEALWFVAHTRPRREKKLVGYCEQQGFATTLPCYKTVHKYRGKTVSFQKPLFPGYVFLQLEPGQEDAVRRNEHVANLLTVVDQAGFYQQLRDILVALESNLEVRLAPAIGEGMRVRIRSGPLQGIEGWVEKRYGMSTVLLRLDFISQAAAVKLQADQLEPA